jgi:hypothetical protein
MNPPRVIRSATPGPASPEIRVAILHVPDCPLVSRLRADVHAVLARIGSSAVIEEIEGAYRSPTLVIDGVEIDGYPAGDDPACRIDLPSQDEITSAVLAATAKRQARI